MYTGICIFYNVLAFIKCGHFFKEFIWSSDALFICKILPQKKKKKKSICKLNEHDKDAKSIFSNLMVTTVIY